MFVQLQCNDLDGATPGKTFPLSQSITISHPAPGLAPGNLASRTGAASPGFKFKHCGGWKTHTITLGLFGHGATLCQAPAFPLNSIVPSTHGHPCGLCQDWATNSAAASSAAKDAALLGAGQTPVDLDLPGTGRMLQYCLVLLALQCLGGFTSTHHTAHLATQHLSM